MIKHLNILISGAVQNVGFRWETKKYADQAGILGFVLNQPDGKVYIEAEGSAADLEKFLNWCASSPGSARVKNVELSESAIQNFSGFEIRK
jgi:acylphosphatase